MNKLQERIKKVFTKPSIVSAFATIRPDGKPWVRYVCAVMGDDFKIDSKKEREAMWYEHLGVFFKGKDDPNYVVMVIDPSRIEVYGPGLAGPEVWSPARHAKTLKLMPA
ncbi:MAG: pyridoxamine 5'-phosphate oxidase family protein [Gammaproteobacteria bacterium]|jgi:hypothetical protein